MKKRLLSLFVVLTMLLAAVCVPVSASTGMLPAKEYDDAVTVFDASSDIGVNGNGVLSFSDGVFVYNSPSSTVQTRFNAFSLDTAADAENWGTLSFKVKADTTNTNDSAITFILGGLNSAAPAQIHPFKMTNTGYMGMGATEAYSQSANDGIEYTKGEWYTVGIIFNKNNTFDYYIDGVHQRNVAFANKMWDGTAPSVYLHANTTKGKFYLDDLTWSTHSFFAESVKTSYAAGATARVKFSEPLAVYDVTKVKLFECETGAEVTGITAVVTDGILEVSLPSSGMNPGKEYRIEMDGFKGATGRTLATDTVYFNCEMEGGETTEVIGSEDFDDFTATNNKGADETDYYQPNGWYLAKRWGGQFDGFVKPSTGDVNYGTSMQIGQKVVANKSETHAYLPFAKTADTGIVKITYEMKPQRLVTSHSVYSDVASPNLQVMVYPDGIDETDKSWSAGASKSIGVSGKDNTYTSPYGRMIAGISAKNISFSSTTSTMTTAKTLSADTADANAVSASDAKWYKVEMVLDFDKGTVNYYLDAEDKGSVALADLDIDAVAGISFGTQFHATDASILIDNVKVEHTYVANVKTDTVAGEDFNDFTATNNKGADPDYYQPSGWYLSHKWDVQTNAFIKPDTDATKGAVMNVGAAGAYDGGGGNAYMPLGKDITSGLVTINFEMKPVRASVDWSSGSAASPNVQSNHPQVPNLVLMVYPDGIDSSDQAWVQGDSKSIGVYGKDSTYGYPYGRVIGGIFANKIATSNNADWSQRTELKTLTMDTTDTKAVSATDSKWYTVKIELDFDAGTTAYYLDGVKTTGATLSTLDIDGIQGISIGTRANAADASTLIDNVSVTHTYNNNSAAGVMQVRFSDYDGNNYGSATTYTTLLDTIAVSFWSKNIDAASLTTSTVKLVNASTQDEIQYVPSAFDAENGVYTMNLREYLTKGTAYKLIVDGVTADGTAIDKYEQTITSDSTGRVIVEPMYIMKNGTEAERGALAAGDTVTAGTRVINTTGNTETYAFFMALYDGGVLKAVDFREIEQDGTSSVEDKDANLSCSYTLSADDAASITSIKAFLWDGFETLGPVLPAIEFTNTAAE